MTEFYSDFELSSLRNTSSKGFSKCSKKDIPAPKAHKSKGKPKAPNHAMTASGKAAFSMIESYLLEFDTSCGVENFNCRQKKKDDTHARKNIFRKARK